MPRNEDLLDSRRVFQSHPSD